MVEGSDKDYINYYRFKHIYKYDIKDREWIEIISTPFINDYKISVDSENGKLYLMSNGIGSVCGKFCVFDLETNKWNLILSHANYKRTAHETPAFITSYNHNPNKSISNTLSVTDRDACYQFLTELDYKFENIEEFPFEYDSSLKHILANSSLSWIVDGIIKRLQFRKGFDMELLSDNNKSKNISMKMIHSPIGRRSYLFETVEEDRISISYHDDDDDDDKQDIQEIYRLELEYEKTNEGNLLLTAYERLHRVFKPLLVKDRFILIF